MDDIRIKITTEIEGLKKIESYQMIDKKTLFEILRVCAERKTNITGLLINDITEMTPEEAEEIILSWDL